MDTLRVHSTKDGKKSRAFSTALVGYVGAPSFWKFGYGDAYTQRPVLLMYCGTDQEIRAFTANLRTGRKVEVIGKGGGGHDTELTKLEIPKSAGFKFVVQQVGDGLQIATAFLPELWLLDPGLIDPEEIAFLCAPPTWWTDAQIALVADRMTLDESNRFGREAAVAAYVCAFIDRRSTLPMVNDLGFHLSLYRKALEGGWLMVSEPNGEMEMYPHAGIPGLEQVLACRISHDDFETFLRELAREFYAEEIERGKDRIPSPGGLLQNATPPAGQLSLFG
jgi:hypothetical protein